MCHDMNTPMLVLYRQYPVLTQSTVRSVTLTSDQHTGRYEITEKRYTHACTRAHTHTHIHNTHWLHQGQPVLELGPCAGQPARGPSALPADAPSPQCHGNGCGEQLHRQTREIWYLSSTQHCITKNMYFLMALTKRCMFSIL